MGIEISKICKKDDRTWTNAGLEHMSNWKNGFN
jgi:hypothetical protein